MGATVSTYSRKGFRTTLAFAAVVTSVSGLVAFLSAPERVVCSRTAEAGVVNCTLSRDLAGRLPMRVLRVQDVGAVSVESHRERTAIGRRTARGGTTYRLRIVAASGIAFSGQSGSGELDSVRKGIEGLVGGTSSTPVEATLSGSRVAHRWSVGFLVFGVSLVPLWLLGYFFPGLRPRGRGALHR